MCLIGIQLQESENVKGHSLKLWWQTDYNPHSTMDIITYPFGSENYIRSWNASN